MMYNIALEKPEAASRPRTALLIGQGQLMKVNTRRYGLFRFPECI